MIHKSHMVALLDSPLNDFSYFFFIYKSLQYLLPSFESNDLSVLEKAFKIYFQDGPRSGHLAFSFEKF